MRRFRFGLESVLRWRQHQLEVEQFALEALLAERERIRSQIWQNRQAGAAAQREILAQPEIEAAELVALEAWVRRLAAERTRLEKAGEECETRISAQRGRVLEARRRLRLLERLRERRFQEWRAELERESETLAAESFLSRQVRERGESCGTEAGAGEQSTGGLRLSS